MVSPPPLPPSVFPFSFLSDMLLPSIRVQNMRVSTLSLFFVPCLLSLKALKSLWFASTAITLVSIYDTGVHLRVYIGNVAPVAFDP